MSDNHSDYRSYVRRPETFIACCAGDEHADGFCLLLTPSKGRARSIVISDGRGPCEEEMARLIEAGKHPAQKLSVRPYLQVRASRKFFEVGDWIVVRNRNPPRVYTPGQFQALFEVAA